MRAFFDKTIAQLKKAQRALLCINSMRGMGLTVFAGIVAFGVFSLVFPASAETGSLVGDVGDMFVTGVTKLLLVTARLAIALCIFFLHFFITLASYNNYINTPVVQVGWIMIRDVANMFFVVALLVIAFGTILGLEQYEWKKGLVKIILAAVFINFSNLIAQLIIDVAHVFTITFLNAVAAAAGGNLIQMFQLTEILSFVQKSNLEDVSNVRLELLGGAIMATIFAVFSAIAMGAYVLVMMARVVLLWVLIIMSPLAFIFQVLPTTEGYAEKWWKEFKEQVLVAPIMVFFLWLTFATLGTGQIIRDIQDGPDGKSNVIPLQNEASNEISVSISKVSSWERMASFLVAVTFLFVGIKEVGETGAVGSRIIGNTVDAGKKIAAYATGYTAAKWLAGGASSVVGKVAGSPFAAAGWLAKKAAWHMPGIGGKTITHKAKTIAAAIRDDYYESGRRLTKKGEMLNQKAGQKREQLAELKNKMSIETDGGKKAEMGGEADKLSKEIGELEAAIEGQRGAGLLGMMARNSIQLEKQLKKTEDKAEVKRKLLWKAVGSEAGGKVAFGMGLGAGANGIGFMPASWQKGIAKWQDDKAIKLEKEVKDLEHKKEHAHGDHEKAEIQEKIDTLSNKATWHRRKAGLVRFFRMGGDHFEMDDELAKLHYGSAINARDRFERGELKTESARGEAKDFEFESEGEFSALFKPRLKFDVNTGKLGFQVGKGSMADQIARHNIAGETWKKRMDSTNGEARLKIVAEFDKRTQTIKSKNAKYNDNQKAINAAKLTTEDSLEKRMKALQEKLASRFLTAEQRAAATKEAEEKKEALTKQMSGFDEATPEGKKAKEEAQKQISELESKIDGIKQAGLGEHRAQEDMKELEEIKNILGTENEDERKKKIQAKNDAIDEAIKKAQARVAESARSVLSPEEKKKLEEDLVALEKQKAEYEQQIKKQQNKATQAEQRRKGAKTKSDRILFDNQKDEALKEKQRLAEEQKKVQAGIAEKKKALKDASSPEQSQKAKEAAEAARLEIESKARMKKTLGLDPKDTALIDADISGLKQQLAGKTDPKTEAEIKDLATKLDRIRGGASASDKEKAMTKEERLKKVQEEIAKPAVDENEEIKEEIKKLNDVKRLKEEGFASPGGVSYDQFLAAKSDAGFVSHILDQDEDRIFHAFEQGEYNLAYKLDNLSRRVNRGDYDERVKEKQDERSKIESLLAQKRQQGVGRLDEDKKTMVEKRKEKQDEINRLEGPLKDTNVALDRIEKAEKEIAAGLEKLSQVSDEDPKKKQLNEKLAELALAKTELQAKKREEEEKQTPEVKEKIASLNAEVKADDDAIYKMNKEIRDAEEKMKKEDPGYTQLEQQLRSLDKEIEKYRNEGEIKAKRLRAGDISVVHEVTHELQHKIDHTKDETEKQRLQKELDEWKELEEHHGHHLANAAATWQYATSKAKQEDTAKGFQYAHNLLLSEAEQREVYDVRGLDTPKTTLTELIEQYGKSFGEMSIDSFVANVGPMLTKMLKKQKDGTITEQDRASLMGLFKRGLDRSWIDDAIYAIRDNAEAKELIGDQLGWKDNIYTDDKIRDIQMLFATGGNVDFVKQNQVMSYVQDVGQNDLKLDMKDILKGMETGQFINKLGKDVTKEYKGKVDELMKRSGLKFDDNSEQKRMLDSIFATVTETDKKKLEDIQKARMQMLHEYMETTRDRQSEFQFLGNLRSEALKSGHVENAGYALTRDVGGGELLYMGMGVRSARNHVMGDAKKMDLRNRAGMQSHSFGYLDENNGQVMTEIHEDKYSALMNGLDSRTYNAVNPRARLHFMGLSSADRFNDYRDADDKSFYVSRMTDSKGNLTNAAKTWNTALSADHEYSSSWNSARTEKEQERIMASAQMNRIFAPQMRGNIGAFVMTAADAAGLNPTNAYMDGKINFKMFNPREGRTRQYQHIQELITSYNDGDFSLNGEKPQTRIPDFVTTDRASQEKAKNILNDQA